MIIYRFNLYLQNVFYSTGVTFPSGEMQQRLVRFLYQEVNISPEEVEYIEAHGTGTKVRF